MIWMGPSSSTRYDRRPEKSAVLFDPFTQFNAYRRHVDTEEPKRRPPNPDERPFGRTTVVIRILHPQRPAPPFLVFLLISKPD